VFIGGAAAFAIMSGRLGFAAVPQRGQRRFFDTTWWDPFVEDIADADTYIRRKFRQDVTDRSTGLDVPALKKVLSGIV
jgi:hypothetical protein